MKLRQSLFSLLTLTLLAFGGWITIFFNLDPSRSDRFVFIALYASLFIFLIGVITFIGFGMRILLTNRELIYSHFPVSLRQATLISFAAVGLLFLQSLRVLSPVDAGAFVLAVLLLELFFRARPKTDSSTIEKEE